MRFYAYAYIIYAYIYIYTYIYTYIYMYTYIYIPRICIIERYTVHLYKLCAYKHHTGTRCPWSD